MYLNEANQIQNKVAFDRQLRTIVYILYSVYAHIYIHVYLDGISDFTGIVEYGELWVLLFELGRTVVRVVLLLLLKLLEQRVVVGSGETAKCKVQSLEFISE